MVHKIYQILESNRYVIGDGAMGTMLQEAGLTTGGAPELWNIEQPEIIKGIYQAYVDAGSNMFETNTFGGTHFRLKLHNLQDQVAELNRAGAALGREVATLRSEVAGDDVLVAGSIGPTGELFEPMGALTYESGCRRLCRTGGSVSRGWRGSFRNRNHEQPG